MEHVGLLHDRLAVAIEDDRDLELSELASLCSGIAPAVHLAVMRQPFLDFVVDGRKTIESRLTRNRVTPFGQVAEGDLVVFKISGGPLWAAALVDAVRSIGPVEWPVLWEVVQSQARELMMTDDWLELKEGCQYGSFFHLGSIRQLPKVAVAKSDRRAWVTLVERRNHLLPPGSLPWGDFATL